MGFLEDTIGEICGYHAFTPSETKLPDAGEDCLGVIMEPDFPGKASCIPCCYLPKQERWVFWNGQPVNEKVLCWKRMDDFIPKRLRVGGAD